MGNIAAKIILLKGYQKVLLRKTHITKKKKIQTTRIKRLDFELKPVIEIHDRSIF